MPETLAYIALGGNVGDVEMTLRRALERMNASPGVRLLRVSRLYWTEAVGGPAGQGSYLNGVAEVATTLEPTGLLHVLQEIERSLGRDRVREVRWGPRTCDLDILLMGDQVVDQPNLTVPHPRLHQRRFVLEGLAELAPDLRHPRLGRTMRELLDELEEKSQ